MLRIVLTRKAFRYRVYPTPAQEARLVAWESSLRFLWNLANEHRLLGLSIAGGGAGGRVGHGVASTAARRMSASATSLLAKKFGTAPVLRRYPSCNTP